MFGWMEKVGGAELSRSPLRLLRADENALAGSLAGVHALRRAHRAGLESIPACWRDDLPLIETWEQTRAEALYFLLRPGAGDMAIHEAATELDQASGLTQRLLQPLCLECGLGPLEAELCVGAVARVYAYLRIAGEGVGLRPEPASGGVDPLLAGLLGSVLSGNSAPAGPGRILELLRRDVLDKTRELALAATFGAQWRHGEGVLLGLLREGLECHGLEPEDCAREIALARLVLKHARLARDPGDLRARLRPLGLEDHY